MPGGFPIGLNVDNATTVGVTTGSSEGVSIATGSSANTKGSYTQIIASTAEDACLVLVTVNMGPSTGDDGAVDLAVGASGSEQIIAANLRTEALDTQLGLTAFLLPLNIPAGSRIAIRGQSTSASDNIFVGVTLFDGAVEQVPGSAVVDTYGFVSTTTLGTAIDPGATANTKGSWVQLSSGLSNDISGYFVHFDKQNQSLASGSGWTMLFDIGIGASGSQQVLLPNIAVGPDRLSSYAGVGPSVIGYIPCAIPNGTAVWARAQASINTATTRVIGMTFYGVRV